ncbi:PAS domain-containing sensor histidine kinase [Lunatibacter salilacus]|uniref:PAS domain-containing sensor histidine kinase n=1 Tax=Lunatibacter salilacus TaxID=2483804 RepID=UPI00131D6C36|nr:PAS domain-containing protein [Lunatibacter salilacus]
MCKKYANFYFLQGGGEMGEFFRATDWSKTALGHPESWPQSLRTTVGILLNSKSPMFLWWSDELTCLYNDAYRPSLGKDGKHPSILGMPGKEAWPEIWHIIDPLISKVVEQGESFWYEDLLVPILRNGRLEDVYWTFSYSPVHNDTGNVTGVLVICTETTEKVITSRKIEESDQRFRNTMKQAPVGITILRGPQYIVEMANDAYLQLIDKTETEFTGNPLFDTLPEVEETVHSLLDSVLSTGIAYHGNELPVPIKRYGKRDIFHFDFIYYPLKEGGKITGVIVVVTDVTEKVETRKKIEEDKRLYETITQNTPDLIYAFDLNYRFTYANEALLKMWGRMREDSIGKGMLELGYEPWHAEMHEREIDQVIATKKSIRGEVSFPHALMGIRMYDYIFTPVINEKGEVEAVTGTTRDISDIKNAQNELKKSEEQFRLLADSMPQHIWTSDTDGNLNYFNQSVFDYSGLTPEQVYKDGWLQIVHPDDRDKNIEVWLNAISTGNDFLFEHRFRRHDGEYRWQLSRAIPQRDSNGKIQMWVGTSTEIQEQKIREEKKDEFISIASHEMKTPLTTAKAYLQMLELLLDEDNEEANLYAKKASQSVNRLNELIGELLDVSKIQLGKLNYNITTFDFNDMIDTTVENIQLTSTTHTIVKTGKVDKKVTGDRDRLQQVVINLLTNAIKYSPHSEKVYINVDQKLDKINVSVKDTGIGIAQHSLDKVFDKYHRVEEHAVQFQGLGIGLFVSYEIIQRHHGKLWAESELGEGSTFYFTLPVTNGLQ